MFFHVHYKCCVLLCGVYGIRIRTLTTLHFNYFAIRSLSQHNVTKHYIVLEIFLYIGTKRLKVQDKTERWKSVENSILVGANAKHDMRVNMCNIYIYNMVRCFYKQHLKQN